MCTIVKVKRKITDDPVDCLIIECKKKRLLGSIASSAAANTANSASASSTIKNDLNSSESIKQILKYVGSATNEVKLNLNFKPNREPLNPNSPN